MHIDPSYRCFSGIDIIQSRHAIPELGQHASSGQSMIVKIAASTRSQYLPVFPGRLLRVLPGITRYSVWVTSFWGLCSQSSVFLCRGPGLLFQLILHTLREPTKEVLQNMYLASSNNGVALAVGMRVCTWAERYSASRQISLFTIHSFRYSFVL